uniref:Helitron_like_N domain-containing protein n=1 Tax=Strongyloides venezuelensis TaxID=75913 RepID=A0A0K0FET1_STRVS
MTTNPNWREITENLYSGQLPKYHRDLIARVFKHKSDALIHGLKENKIMGNVVYLQSTIEFRKKSLLHIHILVDNCVKTDFSDNEKNPRLFEIVTKTIVHSRCDISKTKEPCWDEEKNICIKKSPEHLKYNSHINVKICESVVSSKYLFKYTHKSNGNKIAADVAETIDSKDEVKLHIDVKYVKPSEAV